jgi:uncharacterized repeat protein (TIGR01451 family)
MLRLRSLIARLALIGMTVLFSAAIHVKPAYALADPSVCFAVAEGTNQSLHTIAQDGTGDTVATNTTGVPNIEAISFRPGTQTLYAADEDTLGTIDILAGPTNGVFTAIGGTFGAVSGAAGIQTIDDVDGLSFDPITGVLYGSERRGGQDLLVIIDPATGLVDPNGFGAGIGYVIVTDNNAATSFDEDIDDLAIDPANGTVYAVANAGGTGDQLVVIDRTTGVIANVVGPFGVDDMEGLGFFNDGTFYGVTGDGAGGNSDSLWLINKATGVAALQGPFLTESDFEAVDCLVADPNIKSGFVFQDASPFNGTYDGGVQDTPLGGVTVQIYRDDGLTVGQVDGNDTFLGNAVTAANGLYQFTMGATGGFILQVDTNTLPAGVNFVTDNVEIVSYINCNLNAPPNFVDFGCTETDNDFGVAPTSDLSLTKAVNNPSPNVGDFIIYTITVTNGGPSATDNVRVTDDLNGLAGLVFDQVVSISQGNYVSGTGVWTVGAMAVNDTDTLQIQFQYTGGGPITNIAQVTNQDNFDPDSTPSNNIASEDDQAAATIGPRGGVGGGGDPGDPDPDPDPPIPHLLPLTGARPVDEGSRVSTKSGLLPYLLLLIVGGVVILAVLVIRRRR